jgi:DNA ligase D-like protein (predicted ligase)
MRRIAPRRAQGSIKRTSETSNGSDPLPRFVAPQLSLLRKEARSGDEWVHELKYDGYRLHARIDRGEVRLLTRTGLDWTHRYQATAEALRGLPAGRAYLDGELCAVRPDGTTSFSAMQAATDSGSSGDLVFFLFDLLHFDGADTRQLPLVDRKMRLQALVSGADDRLRYSEHLIGDGPTIRRQACELKAEGLVSKRTDMPYVPGKCLNRQEFVVIGWTDPEGSRRHLESLLLGYYRPDGSLTYAGRAGTGMTQRVLADLSARLRPLALKKMPLSAPPPRESRFGSPLELTRVHWVKPKLVVEVTFLTWTDDGFVAAGRVSGSAGGQAGSGGCA